MSRCDIPWCFQPATELHHKKSRARGGSNNAENLVKVCAKHHRDIHDHNGEWTKKYRTHSWQEEGEHE